MLTQLDSPVDESVSDDGSDGVGVVTFSQSHNCDCMMPKLILQKQH